MNNLGNKEIFAKNLNYYMDKNKKDRNDIARDLDLPYTTITSWCKGEFYPRIDKIQLLANYFGIQKSDLVEEKTISEEFSITKYYMCPVYGQISAGNPNWVEECLEGYLPIDPTLMNILNPEEYFFLRVDGESMNKVIKNGAYALIHKQDIVNNGEIAVVLVNGDCATLKTFAKKNDVVVLTPSSTDDSFKQQIYTKEVPIKILGKYAGKMEIN